LLNFSLSLSSVCVLRCVFVVVSTSLHCFDMLGSSIVNSLYVCKQARSKAKQPRVFVCVSCCVCT
jgi:hypothetical protein